MLGVTVLGLGPLLYCLLYYSPDVWRYLTYDETESEELDIVSWQVSFSTSLNYLIFIILLLSSQFT